MSGRIFGWLLLGLALTLAPAHADSARDAPPAAAEIPKLIPTADFARLADFSDAQLSPDGAHVLFQLRSGGKVQIGYRDVAGGKTGGFAMPDGMELGWMRWAGDKQILIGVQTVAIFYSVEFPRTALLLHNVETGATGWVMRTFKTGDRAAEQGLIGDDVLYVAPDGSHLLLALAKDIFSTPTVYRVSLPDGTMTEIVRARANIWNWYADDSGLVRAGTGWQHGKLRFIYRSSADADFELIGKLDPNKEDSWFSVAQIVTGSDEGFALSDKQTGRVALHRFNYRTGELGELVYGHDQYDIDAYQLTDDGKALRAAYFTDDRDRVLWFDAGEKRTQALIDRALPKLQAWVTSRSRDGQKLLVRGSAPDDPGLYFVLDRATRQMAVLAAEYEGLSPEQLAPTTAVTYAARDGTTIPAFLTLPKGRAAKGLPLIIHPHGGPYGVRDKLVYDPIVQFFANRGYAVLQPNYRGSGGYGTAFGDAGIGQIGRAMQDDLDDGMDWLAGQGTIDPARVCVIGASYGGYAAMWAVIRNPERYRCAASFAGVADWESMLKYDRRYLTKKASERWRSRITGDGDLLLAAVSPSRQAARLTRPLFLAHGAKDSNVPLSQSKKFMAALPKAQKSLVSLHIYPEEGHSFADPASLQDWLDRLETFLRAHNPA
jgi:dipeptidyl aminopeptidase/acylaminoacyl peptidase